jgi:hypothetical protein
MLTRLTCTDLIGGWERTGNTDMRFQIKLSFYDTGNDKLHFLNNIHKATAIALDVA